MQDFKITSDYFGTLYIRVKDIFIEKSKKFSGKKSKSDII